MSKIENIKTHISENKKAYVIGGTVTVAAVGVGVGYFLGVRSVPKSVETSTIVRPIQALNYKSTQTVEVVVEALGDPGNIVQDLTTGAIYASQNQAAKAIGANPGEMSKHLNGLTDAVKGHTFARLGKAAVPQVGTSSIA